MTDKLDTEWCRHKQDYMIARIPYEYRGDEAAYISAHLYDGWTIFAVTPVTRIGGTTSKGGKYETYDYHLVRKPDPSPAI